MSLNIVMNSEIYNELGRSQQRALFMPTIDVGPKEPPQFKMLRITWRIQNFVEALIRFSGQFATEQEWTKSPTRLAFVFGQYTQSLGFNFPLRAFPLETRRGVIKKLAGPEVHV